MPGLVIIEIGYAVNQTEAFSIAARGSGLANGFCHMLPWPENCLANSFASASIDCSTSQLHVVRVVPGRPCRAVRFGRRGNTTAAGPAAAAAWSGRDRTARRR